MKLYHYTCQHMAEEIAAAGHVLPSSPDVMSGLPPMAWFTTLEYPSPSEIFGFGSDDLFRIAAAMYPQFCDPMAAQFVALDAATLFAMDPDALTQRDHIRVSLEPVPVRLNRMDGFYSAAALECRFQGEHDRRPRERTA